MLNPKILFADSSRPAVVGARGEVVKRTTSTMDLAKDRAARGAPDGYVVVAESQTAGRGRKGGWDSGSAQSLLLSVIIRAGFRASERMLIGIMGAVSAAEALQNFGLAARIKWPNDIVVACPTGKTLNLKKLGGVLVEQLSRGDSVPAHVLGIGLNINQSVSQLPQNARLSPASVRSELGRSVDRTPICLSLFGRLDGWYKKLVLGKREELLARWKNLSCLTGRNIAVRRGGQIIHGQVLTLSALGELIIEDWNGKKHYLSDKDSDIMLH